MTRYIKMIDYNYKGNYISREEYDETTELILHNFPQLGFEKVEFLKDFYNLKLLKIVNCGFQDFNGLEHMKQLRYLYCCNNKIQNVDSLIELKSLEKVLLFKNKIKIFPVYIIDYLENLNYLNLEINPLKNIIELIRKNKKSKKVEIII